MNSLSMQVVFNEIPNEISMVYTITGCKNDCAGCHTPECHDENNGTPLTLERLENDIVKYGKYISCILFFGGEWYQDELIKLLQFCNDLNIKTGLYTGQDDVDDAIKNRLTFLKTGRYDFEFGPLHVPTTNQRLVNLKTKEVMNHYFQKG